MADSLLILESFTFTLESYKFAEAEKNYQQSLSKFFASWKFRTDGQFNGHLKIKSEQAQYLKYWIFFF